MKFIDCHNHSSYSFDAESSVYDMCLSAKRAGLTAFAITDHADVNVFEKYDIGNRIQNSLAEISNVKSQFSDMKIIAGIELGQPLQDTARANQLLSLEGLDFVIGSLHNLNKEKDFYYYDFKNASHEAIIDMLNRYYQELYDMAAHSDYDILGHITYPYRYYYQAKLTDCEIALPFESCKESITKILKEVIQRGKGIEINTSGLRQTMNKTMPSEDIIRLYRQLGGVYLSIGSDAHNANDVFKGIKDGHELAKRAGFQYVTYYENRKPVMLKI
ncbi:histidinol-phosphatase HisJ family protein [Paludicola sp. MB14-C6]|uniref:histidinol-phosphatase HisJ family protein n=1 Tax=Paludihabitans sp. MB14-C6 TaxID=3070656 RepID=UPI0027DC8290|nr:histidinol-phosphatase HisJ family protein [Paludicola sp. MB14-C6]WMJ22618.1 histidinol-phosphatase HisJ family protein [Paludicola sp. MB14-C6]